MEKREPKRPGGKAEPFSLDSTALVHRVCDADVLLGRGKRSYNHTGNLRFREMVLLNTATYKECRNKPLRRRIAMTIIEKVQSDGGRFLRPHDPEKKNDGAKAGQWVIVSKSIAMTKVKQALRDSGEIVPGQAPLPQRESSSGSIDPQRIPTRDPSSVPSQLVLGSHPRMAPHMNPVASNRDLVDALSQRRLQQLLLAQQQERGLSMADQLVRQRDQWASRLASLPAQHHINETLPTTVLRRPMFPEWWQPNVGLLNPNLTFLMNAAARSLPQHSMLDDLLLSNNIPSNARNHTSLMDTATRQLAVESMLSQQRLLQANPPVLAQSLNQLNRGPIPARSNEPAAGNAAPPTDQQQTQDDSSTSELDTHAAMGR